MLTSTDTPNMPSEAQEVINVLGSNGYNVQLLQSNISSLELYRTLQRGPYPLVWVASHSSEQGFMFGATLIKPVELAQFLEEAKATDLVLNSCYSIDHISQIQGISNVNVVATIDPNLDDKLAWSSALYLATSLVRNGTLRQAYQTVLAGSGSPYRWFPALRVRTNTVQEENVLDRVEKSLDRVMRILHGDPYLHAAGIVDLVSNLQTTLKEHVESDEQWKRETEVRIRVLEANNPGATVILTRQTVRLLITFFILATIFLFFIVYLLRG